jgi:hypothetical protein
MSFIQTGIAQRILNIQSRRTMQDLLVRKALLHIRLGNNRSRLVPEAYVLGLTQYQHGRDLTSALVRQFNATTEGQRLIAEAKKNLATAINERPKHTVEEVVAIFGVEHNTVGRWIRSGLLQAETERRPGVVSTSGKPQTGQYAVAAETLRRFATWVTPV